MAQKTGRVTTINQDGWAMVVTEKGDACSNCESAQFCHSHTGYHRHNSTDIRISSIADSSSSETQIIRRNTDEG